MLRGRFTSDDEFKDCKFRSRQESDASTMLPNSPMLSRRVSPVFSEADRQECEEFELSGLPDEISDTVLATIQAQSSKSSFEESSSPLRTGCKVFLPVMLGILLYAVISFMTFHIFMGMFMGGLAALMLLPGVYLWVVDGCRPEDFEEDDQKRSSGGLAVVTLSMIGLVPLVYGLSSFMSFRILMGGLAALMLLPGVYLWVVDGCRPEDYDEADDDRVLAGQLPMLTLSMISLVAIVYGLSSFMSFRIFMGGLVAFMLLPGVYLWAVDGCRPDESEGFNLKQE
eukprot:TRINITY_DN5277_c0_g1_i2.p1 TRINITY_DN5277_c0_g1~~TRINITY_DN5277_c0_g1_i2.p1  ORF type:complete len:283 (+),score=55.50 TRINITY_DN5277_c0_g1_i2:74-922(+)